MDFDEEEFTRSMYADMTPAKLVECEQFYAGATHMLETMVTAIGKDVERREQITGIRDDSVQFAILHLFVGKMVTRSSEDIFMIVNMLSAALFKLVRAPRTEPNPLAHLDNEGDKQ